MTFAFPNFSPTTATAKPFFSGKWILHQSFSADLRQISMTRSETDSQMRLPLSLSLSPSFLETNNNELQSDEQCCINYLQRLYSGDR